MTTQETNLRSELAQVQERRARALSLAQTQREHYAEHIETVFYLDGVVIELTNRILALRQQ